MGKKKKDTGYQWFFFGRYRFHVAYLLPYYYINGYR